MVGIGVGEHPCRFCAKHGGDSNLYVNIFANTAFVLPASPDDGSRAFFSAESTAFILVQMTAAANIAGRNLITETPPLLTEI